MNEAPKPPLMTTKEACEYLGITANTLYARRAANEIDYFKFGKTFRYAKADLDAYIDRCRIPSTARILAQRRAAETVTEPRKRGRPPKRQKPVSGYVPGMKVVG